MTKPAHDIRIGTMVQGQPRRPGRRISRQILPLGFESIQPFFWQTLDGKDIPRLAGEIREAIGNRRRRRQLARHVRQSARRTATSIARRCRAGRRLHRQRAPFGADMRRRLHRPHPRQAADRQPAALQARSGASSPSAPPTRASRSPSRTARWTATGRPATGTSPTIPTPGS